MTLRRDFLDLITSLHDKGLTVVMISHSMDDLASRCDRVLVLNEGSVFDLGTPEKVFSRAAELNDVGLGLPSAQRMANDLRARGVPLPEEALFDADSLAAALAALARPTACETESAR